jgi:hypothetical protein
VVRAYRRGVRIGHGRLQFDAPSKFVGVHHGVSSQGVKSREMLFCASWDTCEPCFQKHIKGILKTFRRFFGSLGGSDA